MFWKALPKLRINIANYFLAKYHTSGLYGTVFFNATFLNKRSKSFRRNVKDWVQFFSLSLCCNLFWTQVSFQFQHWRLPLEWVLWSKSAIIHRTDIGFLTKLKGISVFMSRIMYLHVRTFMRSCPDIRAFMFRLSCVLWVCQTMYYWTHDAPLVFSSKSGHTCFCLRPQPGDSSGWISENYR